MDELHRMLGSARRTDFDREAANRQLAKVARPAGRGAEPVAAAPDPRLKRRSWFLALVTRESRAGA